MARTIISDVFNPEILTETVQGVFAQKTAFMGSALARLGVCVVAGTMPEGGPDAIGTTIKVPYFGVIGDFEENVTDGDPATPKKIQQTNESATITRDTLAFEVSRWAQANANLMPGESDPYTESARQIMQAAERAMDKRIIAAAKASGVFQKNVWSSTVPVGLSYDLLVEAMIDGWGDEGDDAVAFLTHSHGKKDLLKLKDSTGRPLLVESQREGELDRFCGLPVVVSDRCPLDNSAMGAVTSSGTNPPVLTITGTPLGAYKLHIDCTLGGAHQTAKYRFSVDGGNTWSGEITTLGAGVAQSLVDPAIDSTLGVNGQTGLSVAFAAGTFNANNLWTSTAALQVMSMLLKRRALAFWYSRRHLGMETDKDILRHTDLAAMHLYGAAHRYRRVAGGTKPGVIQIVHNVSSF